MTATMGASVARGPIGRCETRPTLRRFWTGWPTRFYINSQTGLPPQGGGVYNRVRGAHRQDSFIDWGTVMFRKATSLKEAVDWVITNNMTLGTNPSRFRQKVRGQSGQNLGQAVACIINSPGTRQHQINKIASCPQWWTIEDLVVHSNLLRSLPTLARKRAKDNHQCYENVRRGLPC